MDIYRKLFISILTDSLEYLVYLYMLKNNNVSIDILNDNELFENYAENNLENIIILLNEILNNYQIKYSIWNKQFQPMLNTDHLYKEYYDSILKLSRMFRINDDIEITDMNERSMIMQECVENKNHINIDLMSFLKMDDFNSIEDICNYFQSIYTNVKFPIKNDINTFTILSIKNNDTVSDIYVDDSKYWSDETWKIIENA